ncbi:MAG: hypothetical protein SF069_19050 [Phycisphaerae bacterium]|nr:hypothetical protein [Phycisphaerae bacterium]
MSADFEDRWERVVHAIEADGRYSLSAFGFLVDVQAAAVARVYADVPTPPEMRHVTGRDICDALRIVATERWGPLATTVLKSWGVRRTRDVGEMVYLLVREKWWGVQESDRIEEFDDVFHFDDAFGAYEPRTDLTRTVDV